MSFLEHLDELRRRLVVAIVAVACGFLVALVFIDRIFEFVMVPLQRILPRGGKLIYTEPTEAFMLQLKVAALAGLVLAAPLVMSQVWLFVAPGLYAKEKRFALPFVFFSSVFFVAGAAFSHYVVFPTAWTFLASFTTDYMQFTPRVSSTFSLYSRMLLAFGLVFQMPTIVLALARMGVVSAGFLVTPHQVRHPDHLRHRGRHHADFRRGHSGADGRPDDRPLRPEHRHRLGVRPAQEGHRRRLTPAATGRRGGSALCVFLDKLGRCRFGHQPVTKCAGSSPISRPATPCAATPPWPGWQ